MSDSPTRYDLDGFEYVTNALSELLNTFPAITTEEISFTSISEDGGVAFVPVSGAAIETEKEDITGHVTQVCSYPFYVMYRMSGTSEKSKINVKEWLDNLGKWLEGEPITVRGKKYILDSYPTLQSNRKFKVIERQTPSYLSGKNSNNSEDWVIMLNARYSNEFDRFTL